MPYWSGLTAAQQNSYRTEASFCSARLNISSASIVQRSRSSAWKARSRSQRMMNFKLFVL